MNPETFRNLPDLAATDFLSAPAGIGVQARFDVDAILRAVDAILQGWLSGKLALGEGDLLPRAFKLAGEWVRFAVQPALVAVLNWSVLDFLPRLVAEVASIAARYPEVQKQATIAAAKLDERVRVARAARARHAQSISIAPVQAAMTDYTRDHTALAIMKARVPPDAAGVKAAQETLAASFGAVTGAHEALYAGLDAITAAAQQFFGGLADIPPTRVTPAQRRTAMEYDAIIDTLKGAWVFPALSPIPRVPLPNSRGKGLFNRVFAALRKGPK